MEFHDNQWYRGRDGRHPVCGVWVPDKHDENAGKVNWWQLGVNTVAPQFADFDHFASYIAYLDSPMTEEQVQLYAQKMKEHYEKNK